MGDGVSTIIYPLTFAVQKAAYREVIENVQKMNPGNAIDLLDPQTPMLIPHCLCGEEEMIYLEEQTTDIAVVYRYKCNSCSTSTKWTPSRGDAIQLWRELQTK